MTTVFAASGKITIENAEAGKTYKIYEILHLESYNEEKMLSLIKQQQNGNHSLKVKQVNSILKLIAKVM